MQPSLRINSNLNYYWPNRPLKKPLNEKKKKKKLTSKRQLCSRTFHWWATRVTRRTSDSTEAYRCIIRIRCTIRMRHRVGNATSCCCVSWARPVSESAARSANRSVRDFTSCNRSTIYCSIYRHLRRHRTSRISHRTPLPPPSRTRTSAPMVRRHDLRLALSSAWIRLMGANDLSMMIPQSCSFKDSLKN